MGLETKNLESITNSRFLDLFDWYSAEEEGNEPLATALYLNNL